MSCRDWEERIAAARDGAPDETLCQHLAGCPRCLQIAGRMAEVASAFSNWDGPALEQAEVEAARAGLAERLVVIRRSALWQPEPRPRIRFLDQPAAIAVAGGVAMAAGAWAAPGWVRWALACWVALAWLVALVVLLHGGHESPMEGEY